MSTRHTQKHQPPIPTEALPKLSEAERRNVLRMARMIKSRQLWEYSVRLHEDEDILILNWKDEGGACLAT